MAEADAAGDTAVGGATPPMDPLTVESIAIPEDGASGPAVQPAAVSADGTPAPASDAPDDGDASPPARPSPERLARLAGVGAITATDDNAEVTR